MRNPVIICGAALCGFAAMSAVFAESLNGKWHYIVDVQGMGYSQSFGANRHGRPTELIEYDFSKEPTMDVPGDWNTQDERLFFYEGVVWFERDFDWRKTPGMRSLLSFDGVSLGAKVWVNGKAVGGHEGGFTPFTLDVTDAVVDGPNFVVVAVDNIRRSERIPMTRFDWWNYGGIIRDVTLEERPALRVDDWSVGLDGVRIRLNEPKAGVPVSARVPALGFSAGGETDAEGVFAAEFTASPELWSPESPKLYEVEVEGCGERLSDMVGFRTIATEGKKILLNGKPIFLKGVCVHDEPIGRNGRVRTDAEAEALVKTAKDLGCNFLRLAHYPHDRRTVRAAERLGLLVWSEIPLYWSIAWKNGKTFENAKSQLREMIRRDRNRANVIIWSLANETARTPDRDKFLRSLAAEARSLDSTRLISLAMEVTGHSNYTNRLDDSLHDVVDVVSFNEYIGWYRDVGAADKMAWVIPYDKPVIVSEFGGGAVAGRHGDSRHRFTEENQAEIYRANLRMFERIDGLAGITPWILKDFLSPRRPLAGTQDMHNRKGLIDENGVRKAAFDVLKEWYSSR